jgi:stage II sporulation protein D
MRPINWAAALSILLAAGSASQAGDISIRVGLLVRVPKASVRVDKKKGTVNGRRYRGTLKVVPSGGNSVTVVNVVELEDYLRSVVPAEMPYSWPKEALKAQAVVARSYAVSNRGRYASEGFDLCATAACQVYEGTASENASSDEAVKATRGEVVMYMGRPISAVFHSSCGGRTDDARDVWRSDGKPYLRGVRSPWCRQESPHYQWEAKISDKDMAGRLAAAGHDVGPVESIRIVSRTKAGRAYEVRVTGTKSAQTFQANAFRLIVGPKSLRSTLWSGLSHSDGEWRFHGKGWGHGVGLCQWCSKVMAGQGHRYKEILTYFYRNTKVKKY